MLRTAGLVVALLVHVDAQARTKLRPEHLEPERVEVERPATRASEKRTAIAVARPTAARSGAAATTAREQCTRATELYVAGNFTEAAAVYKQVIASYGDFAPAHRGLGFVYQRLGFAAMAIGSYRRYLALAPAAADIASIEARIERLGGTR